jgi:redox-sensing transcriptional repressor
MPRNKTPNAVIARLPIYYRYLSSLEEMGFVRISSQQLGERMGVTASQIRQDINCFGGFGQQGYGYNVSELRKHIGEILGLKRAYKLVVVGAGNIGQAITNYAAFREMGFAIDALFDTARSQIGLTTGGVLVRPLTEMAEYLADNPADIGVIATPKSAAQSVCDALTQGGVRAIWNFAPVDLNVAPHIALRSVHLSDALLVLSYHMMEDDRDREN